MKVLKDFDNRLCSRNEYTIEVNHLGNKTPGKDEIRRKVAELTGNPENVVAVEGTFTKYGFGRSMVHAYVYDNEESFKKFEIVNKRNNGKEKKGKEQAA